MKRYELHAETADAYHVRHPAGHVFAISKAGAHPALVKALRMLPQAAAPKLADGAVVPDAPLDSPAGPVISTITGRPVALPVDVARDLGVQNPTPAPSAGDVEARMAAESLGQPSVASPAAGPALSSLPSSQMAGAPAGAPQGGAAGPVQAPAQQADPFQFPRMPGYPSGGLERQISAAQQTGREGAEQKAQAEAQQAADMASAHQGYLDNLQQIEQKRRTDLAGVQQELGAAQDDVKNFRMDPSHFWSSRGTGQKITALIGVALGGLGSALTGQQNTAFQAIQSFIDRDIEAQKLDLGKKENLVSMLYRKYGTVEDASNAARSYLTAAVAGQAGLAAARSGGAMAQANAKLLESQLQGSAIGPMAQIVNGKYQAETARYQMDWQRRMFQYGMQMVNGNGQQQGGGYLPSRAPPPSGTDPMNPMKYAVEARKDAAERTIPGPGGKPFLAYDKSVAEKVRPALAAASTARKLLGELQNLRANHSGMPGSDAADQYEKTRRLFAEQWAMTLGQASLSDTQFTNLEKIMPSKWDAFVRGSSRFEPIAKALHERASALYDQAGLDPRAMPIYEQPAL